MVGGLWFGASCHRGKDNRDQNDLCTRHGDTSDMDSVRFGRAIGQWLFRRPPSSTRIDLFDGGIHGLGTAGGSSMGAHAFGLSLCNGSGLVWPGGVHLSHSCGKPRSGLVDSSRGGGIAPRRCRVLRKRRMVFGYRGSRCKAHRGICLPFGVFADDGRCTRGTACGSGL